MVHDTALYDLLEVQPNATQAEIKAAYRKKAMQNHPDKNPDDPEAGQKFQEISNAYEILSDSQARAHYDREGLRAGGGRGGRGGPGFGGFDMDEEDFLAQMFGGGGFSFPMGGPRGPPGKRRPPTRGEDSVIPYEVSLEDLYNGKAVKMQMEKSIVCSVCEGSGTKGKAKPATCSRCNGDGMVTTRRQIGPNQHGLAQVICPNCLGDGTVIKEKDRCKKCKGEKTVKEKKRLEIFIEKGMLDRQRIVLSGEGDQEPGVPPGDVVFQIKTKAHETFERSGPDLLTTVRITLSEALTGFDRIMLTHLDGRGIHMKSPKAKIMRAGDTIVVKGEGMPIPKTERRGDLYVMFDVEMPTEDWARTVDLQALAALLPPKKPDLIRPPIVDQVDFEMSDINAFGEGNEDDWEDEDDLDDLDDPAGLQECRHQ